VLEPDTTEIISKNFITNIIEDDLRLNRNGGRVVTRFPPEPNGYLHLGHAKSICLNFGIAKKYKGVTHMRFDDTNPAKEYIEYVKSILEDVKWLTSDEEAENSTPWFGPVRHASDYFDTLYHAAIYLVKNGLAYVDDLTPDQMKEYRGTLTEPGKDSPYRKRGISENLDLFESMATGKFPDGHCVLRAKIDNTSPNLNLRDPTLYRIKRAVHPITGSKWCIYPMYDFAHAVSDACEGITHSLCTLEFADHRPLYDWIIDSLNPSGLLPFSNKGWRPVQTEFSRLNLQFTVLSKRKLIQLVNEKYVTGWDDPRMPTICGVRRRGYPASAIKLFCERVGISKADNNIDMSVLEDCVRETLDSRAPRILAVQHPLKITVTNWPNDKVEIFEAERHPKVHSWGKREIPFSGEVYIDREDFFDTGIDGSTSPPKGFKRLVAGGTVRLKYAYVISCDEVVRDPTSNQVIELKCSYDAGTRAGASPEGAKKAKGIIQWVSQKHAIPAQLKLFDRLFLTAVPGQCQVDGDFLKDLNPNSCQTIATAFVEPSLCICSPGDTFQFERMGYFCFDTVDNNDSNLMTFNRVVTLKDTWAGASSSNLPSKKKDVSEIGKFGPSTPQQNSFVEDVRRIDIRVGKIISADKHPDAESLYVETIDCGDDQGPRTVISGLAKFLPLESLVGKMVLVVCNLKPAKMRGIESEGMVLCAVSGAEENKRLELINPPENSQVGEMVCVENYEKPLPDIQLKSKSQQDVWKRVSAELMTNDDGEVVYGKGNKCRLITTAGPCTALLKNAAVQ